VSYYESRIKALEARIEEMAQLERMKAVKVEAQLMITISELQVENARLKADVERVGAENSHLHKGIYSLSLNVCQLKDDVERLTKAGDAMAKELIRLEDRFNGIESAEAHMWYIAKEGGCP